MNYVLLIVVAIVFAQDNGVGESYGGTCGQTCCQDLKPRAPMTFRYYQNTGRFIGGEGEYHIATFGYSGAEGEWRNNPTKECVINKGPAPATIYKILECQNTMHNPPIDRPCAFWIDAVDQSKMCGRSEIMIHGCRCCTNGDWTEPPIAGCSAGCIIINEENRKKLRVGDTIIVEHIDPMDSEFILE